MRIALLSDIHGNLLAFEAVLADIASRGAFDQIVAAGDLAWAGPWPAEVVDRVREATTAAVQGNTDTFCGYPPDAPPEDKQPGEFAALQRWTCQRLGPERVAYLLALPFAHRVSPAPGHDLLVVHATPSNIEQHITPQMDDEDLDDILGPAEAADWEVLAFGHYHIPFVRRWRGHLLVDVSSVGLPRDGDRRSVYATLTWDGRAWQAEHHRVLYDVPVVAHTMQTCGLPRGKYFAERLVRARYSH